MTAVESGPAPFERAATAAAVLAERTGVANHDVAVVLGSGWASAAEALDAPGTLGAPYPLGALDPHGALDPLGGSEVVGGRGAIGGPRAEVPMADLGGPAPGVAGHAGVVRSLQRGGQRVLVLVGRVHAYEGHSLGTVVHGVRMAVAAGCRTVVLTNAAGGVNPSYQVGQPVLISDHLNLTGRSPLSGPEPPPPYGSRFVDLTDLYSAALRAAIIDAVASGAAAPTGGGRAGGVAPMVEGVYAGLPGPHYETPAEIRALRTLGADLVGMSTVHEAIAARHAGAAVVGISLVTNPAAGVTGEALSHGDVVAAGRAAAGDLGRLLAVTLDVIATSV